MATYTLQPIPPLAADDGALGRIMRQAGVAKDSLIRVTGPAGLTAMLWLHRRGYERAAYIHANRVPLMQAVDVLLVPHPCGTRELEDLLAEGECVREGGVLIVQAAPERSDQIPGNAPALLARLGYELEHRLVNRGSAVYVARRRGLGGFKKAA